MKAKQFTESKSSITEFYYNIHVAQIFESAGRDELSLSFYHKAKGNSFFTQNCLECWPQFKGKSALILTLAWALPCTTWRNTNTHWDASKRPRACMDSACVSSLSKTRFFRITSDAVWWCLTEIKKPSSISKPATTYSTWRLDALMKGR